MKQQDHKRMHRLTHSAHALKINTGREDKRKDRTEVEKRDRDGE